LGVRGTFGKDQFGRHQERRLNLDTLPLSRVRTYLSSGNCQVRILTFSTCFQLWVPVPGWTTPTAKRQLPKAIHYQRCPSGRALRSQHPTKPSEPTSQAA
jgi:hypothetical protein